MLRDLWRSNTILLIWATFLSGALSGQFFTSDNLLFFLPPLLWSLALCVTARSTLKDRGYGYLAFTSLSVILWILVCALALMFPDTSAGYPFSAFSIAGAIGAMCSYWLFARIVLDHFDYRYLLSCFVLGYLAITLCQLQQPGNEVLRQKGYLFVYWQTLVGLGHGIAYYKTTVALWKNKKQLT